MIVKLHSIRTKVTFLTSAAILLSVALVGSIAIAIARHEADNRSAELMTLTCSSKCDEINRYLSYAEEGLRTVSRFAYDSLDSEVLLHSGVIGVNGSGRSLWGHEPTDAQQTALDSYFEDYLSQMQVMFNTVAESNPNVLTYYARINPELSRTSSGFWYSRQMRTGFESQPLTDLDGYAPDDMSHVGWYYLPLDRGMPSWLGPYYNINMDKTILSYVIPLYRFGTFIGIIGVDLDFEELTERIGAIKILESGYAFLTDSKGKIVYHPQLASGLFLAEVNSELEAAEFNKQSTGPIRYRYGGVAKKAVWGTLVNGLMLVVAAPVREINAGWNLMTLYIAVAAALILTLFTLLAASLMRRITGPLEQLAEASKQLAAGDYDLELAYGGNDEVGTLTQSFLQMSRELRTFISDLNSKAYRDDLTGVKNKAALTVFTRKLDDSIASSEETTEFAMVVFDCNSLKAINDNYGHERGDQYLQTACKFICKVYAHSPVFRTGGDEFAVILTGNDLINAAQLEAHFDARASQRNAVATHPWETVDVARGRANYDASIDANVASVMRRADMAMYADKRMKKRQSQTR